MCYELFISDTEIGHNLFPLIFFFFRIVICWVFYCYGFLVQAVVVSLYRVPVTRVFSPFFFHINYFPSACFCYRVGYGCWSYFSLYFLTPVFYMYVILFFMGWRNMAGSGLLSNGTAVIECKFLSNIKTLAACSVGL